MQNPAIEEFIRCRRIAVAGASRSGKKFGNAAAKELQKRGFQIFLVHPEAREIDGQPCYPNLAALRDRVDAVLSSMPATQAAAIMRPYKIVSPLWCWGCMTFTGGDPGKRCGATVTCPRVVKRYGQQVQ
jgi:hypothetical protein